MDKPPRLEQFSASYDAERDRLLMRIRCSDDTEFRFWITRRYLALLWPTLMKMAEDFSALKATDPFARNALAELAHGQAVGNADFASLYKEGSIFPLGEKPILLARITTRPMAGGTQTLTLLPQQGQGINLDLNEKLVHVLARLLQHAATVAEWGLKLDIGATPGTTGDPAQTTTSRLLH